MTTRERIAKGIQEGFQVFEPLHGVCGVYCIVHQSTGQCYVGSSVNIGQRVRRHITDAFGRKWQTHFRRTIREDGPAAFDCVLLEQCTSGMRIERETFWIRFLATASAGGFNVNPTGSVRVPDGHCADSTRARLRMAGFGRRLSPESRARISAAHTGRKLSPERAAKTAALRKGTKLSPEHIRKLREGRAKYKLTPEHLASISAAHRGKTIPPELRARLSAANLGKKPTPETRAKLSAAMRGRVFSSETRAKISAARKAWWAAQKL